MGPKMAYKTSPNHHQLHRALSAAEIPHLHAAPNLEEAGASDIADSGVKRDLEGKITQCEKDLLCDLSTP